MCNHESCEENILDKDFQLILNSTLTLYTFIQCSFLNSYGLATATTEIRRARHKVDLTAAKWPMHFLVPRSQGSSQSTCGRFIFHARLVVRFKTSKCVFFFPTKEFLMIFDFTDLKPEPEHIYIVHSIADIFLKNKLVWNVMK